MPAQTEKAIAIWLLVCCAAIFVMVILGGVTRLTGSGLSMVNWAPIMGVVPPLNEAEWRQAFALYRQFPEYQQKNFHIDVEAFKSIFWFEYSHRMMGRFIGILFFIPMLYFIVTKKASGTLPVKLVIMLALGGLQGLLGWYMVKSGLVDNPYVSQYRLTMHLGLAFIIYAYIFWVAVGLLLPQANSGAATAPVNIKYFAWALLAAIFVMVISGGFVAGLKAGFAYNTFPLMAGRWIPDGLLALQPAWKNMFENVATVQFQHRVLAMILLFAVPVFYYVAIRHVTERRIKMALHIALAVIIIQFALGVATLLLVVPTPLAATHQAGALLLFTVMLFITQQINRQSAGARRQAAPDGH